MPLDEFLVIFFGRFAVALVTFNTETLHRLFLGCGVWCKSGGTEGRTLPVGRFPAQRCIPPTPLLSYYIPAGIRHQTSGVTLMQGVTKSCWCSSCSILTGVVQVAGRSKFPDLGSEGSARTPKSLSDVTQRMTGS